MIIKDKVAYFQETLMFLDQYNNARLQLFKELCEKLSISEKDKSVFFDYCMSGKEDDLNVIKSYLV